MKRYAPFAIIVAVFVIAVGSGALFFGIKQQRITAARIAAATAAKAPVGKPGAQPPHVRGVANFECRPCGDLSPILEKIEQDYGARLRVIFRQFPLAMHKHAGEAARASEAAGLQGRFWEMHDLLYRNRFLWPRMPDVRVAFKDYAKSLGLDLERFAKDMESEQVSARIAADRQRGTSLGVDRTPAVFIDDRRVPETSLNPPALRALIDAAINENPNLPKGQK
jgi:protein-disulfide isomerase